MEQPDLIEDDGSDFQLIGDLIPSETYEQEAARRLKAATAVAERETPDLFIKEEKISFSISRGNTDAELVFSKGGKEYKYFTYDMFKARQIEGVAKHQPGKAWDLTKKYCMCFNNTKGA